uniref:RING-type E3 ubiquitin transferase n=1 Tax=Serinus canaria TaxID=9135 RepID=A0A8C9N737_SERCA
MAGGAKEGTGESGSAAGAGPLKAAVGSECPICLGAMRKPAFVAYCMHQFCFRCIRHWARAREDCPVCKVVPGQSSAKLQQQNTPLCFVLSKLTIFKDFTDFYCLYHHKCGAWHQKLMC